MKRLMALTLSALSVLSYAQIPDYVPTDGLVAWYPFNGNADDESGNDNDGTVNGASLSSDRFNNSSSAFDFDGFNDFIDCGNAPSIQISGALTYSAWINLDTYTNFSGIIGRGKGTGGSKAISMLMITSSGSKRLRFEISEGDPYESVSSPQDAIQPGTWTHVVGVWYGADADSMAVFIDGTLSASAPSVTNSITGGTDPSDNLLKIGNRDRGGAGNSYGWFDGRIDDLGVWNRALSNDEILGLFLNEPPNPGCTDSAACNFDENASFDDGSCIPSGCMDAEACNFNSLAQCEGEACDYTCCPGPGCCSVGHYWDWAVGKCFDINPADTNLDGCVQLNDLLDVLSAYGDCGAGEAPWACGDPLSYQGYDYATVQIGDQCWFAENLKYLPSVSQVTSGSETDSSPHAYVYGYNGTNVQEAQSHSTYTSFGALYNFEAVSEWEMCPNGWHVPSDDEFGVLEATMGMPSSDISMLGWRASNLALGNALRSNEHWVLDDGVESGIAGFHGHPSGYRISWLGDEYFENAEVYGAWWTSTADSNPQKAFHRGIASYNLGILRTAEFKQVGFAVRCLQDAE